MFDIRAMLSDGGAIARRLGQKASRHQGTEASREDAGAANAPTPAAADVPLDASMPRSPGACSYEQRPQQIAMARAVEDALACAPEVGAGEDSGDPCGAHLLVEAGTGVGKSFAYLLPAIKRIVEHNERVVIATNTIALQEQLMDKDIPLLQAVVPGEFSAVLVKGRGNYVSLRRLERASARQDRLFTREQDTLALHQIEDWAYETPEGTRQDMNFVPAPAVWDHIQSDAHNCMGRKCPQYDKCFFQGARRRMERGQLLICNHAIFFADLALRGKGVGILPPYDHVILDEAHKVEEVAADYFGGTLSSGGVMHLLNILLSTKLSKGFLTTVTTKEGSHKPIDDACEAVLRCRNRADELFGALLKWKDEVGPGNGRIREPEDWDGESPVICAGEVERFVQSFQILAKRLRFLKEVAAKEQDQFELQSYALRADAHAEACQQLMYQEVEGCVYFLESPEVKRKGRAFPRVTVRAVAVDVAPLLREHLFDKPGGIVLTSATLTTPGKADEGGDQSFAHIKRQLGCEHAQTLAVGSPFYYEDQMRVVVEPPNEAEQMAARVYELVRESDGGAFVLFTSFAMLNRVAAAIEDDLVSGGHPVLVQGRDGPTGLLLKKFRADERSVLFGTNSFWQGVDVRGRGLRLVIITKLPFDVPDQPVVEARGEMIQARGGNPFMEDAIPRAVLRFRQGVGRLIRSGEDEGTVAILDPRIVTKRYGQMFIRGLPEGVRVEMLEPLGHDQFI